MKLSKTIIIISSILFSLYAATLIFPFLYVLLNSFKTNGEFIKDVWKFPKKLFEIGDLFQNYRLALEEWDVVDMFINSAVLTVAGALVATASPVIVAYILAKYQFKLNSTIFSIAIIFMVVPNVGITVARFAMLKSAGLINTYLAPVLLAAGPFGAYFILLYGYFKGISWAYAEAAYIDGANEFRVFIQIMLPQALPGISTILLLNVINAWNDYFTPYMYMPGVKTVATGIQTMSYDATAQGHYTELFAAMILSLIPVMTVFALFQKTLMNNVMAGGLKG